MEKASSSDPMGWEHLFALNLQVAREREQLYQYELARLASDRGARFHQTTVARIESGQRSVKLGEAKLLAELVHQSLDDMMRQVDESSARNAFHGCLDYSTLAEVDRASKRALREATGAMDKPLSSLHGYLTAVQAAGSTPDLVVMTAANVYIVECKNRRYVLQSASDQAAARSPAGGSTKWDPLVRQLLSSYDVRTGPDGKR